MLPRCFSFKNILSLLAILTLLVNTILPGIFYPQHTFAEGPPPPTPTPTSEPPAEPSKQQLTPPSPDNLSPKAEAARARQAMTAAAEKWLRYWGPRYELADIQVTVEDKWAYGQANWTSDDRPFDGPVYILAQRLPDGMWHAVLPGRDELFEQWVEEVPEQLVSVEKKAKLRANIRDLRLGTNQKARETPLNSAQEVHLNSGILDPRLLDTTDNTSPPTPIAVPAFIPSKLQLITGTVLVNKEIERAVLKALVDGHYVLPEADYFAITNLQEIDSRFFVSVIGLKGLEAASGWRLHDNGIWFGLVLVNQDVNQNWLGAVEGTIEFSKMLANVSEGELSEKAKRSLDPLQHNPSAVETTYRFPWSTGTSMQYGSAGVHDNGFGGVVPGWKAVDFLSDGDTGAGHAPNSLLASASGSIGYVCNDGTSVAIKIDNLFYTHLLYNGNLNTGHYFNQGDVLGQMKPGTFSNTCGYAQQNANWFHVHWGFPNTGFHQAEGWTLNLVDGLWRRGNEARGTLSWFEAEGTGGSCSAPSLNSPDDGFTTSDHNITFNWSAPGDCTPDGYTFRVKTIPDMDSGGTTVIDEGQGGTQVTKQFSSELENTDLYWSVRACDPCTPFNPGDWAPARRFRIENSPTGNDWNAEYFNTRTCWDDHSQCNNPQHTNNPSIPGGGVLINENWGNESPGGSVSSDNWTGKFATTFNFPAGDYVFYADHDDGLKLKIGNYGEHSKGGSGSGSLICADGNQGYSLNGDTPLEFYLREDGGDARIKVWYSTDTSVCVPPTPDPPALQSPDHGAIFNEGQSVTLSWSDTGDEYYGEVWGGPAGTTPFGWQSATSKNIGSQWAGYTYSWHVKARNSSGESDWSDTRQFTVRPAAPSNLNVTPTACDQIDLAWNDNSGSEAGFKIYRNGVEIAQVGADVQSYQDAGLNVGTAYNYKVRAYRDSIESPDSNTAGATTPACPVGPDLVPTQWGGWQYPIVPASITGTNVVNTLLAGYPTYIDHGAANAGDEDSVDDVYGDLYLDGVRISHYNYGNITAGQSWAFIDRQVNNISPGWHTLRTVIDPDNLVTEANEDNNTWERDFYWVHTAPYNDNMENGLNNWTAGGLWHQVDAGSPYPASHSGVASWWYGQDATGDYDTGTANAGDLTSPPIYIPDTGHYLRFWYRYETEAEGPDWDQRRVQISVDGGPFTNIYQLYDDPMNRWQQSPAIDLSPLAGHIIRIRFYFDTVNETFNTYRGWYIDDVEISTTPPPSCNDDNEPNNDPSEATSIAYGESITADICAGGDYDFYAFNGSAGDRVVVDIDAKVNDSLLDSYIFLLDSDGATILSANDDEILGEVQDSHLGYDLNHDGLYYIKVKAWDHPSAGSSNHFYTLHLLTDDTKPSSAEITAPEADAWLDPTLQTITADATDDESGISRVEFLWHNEDWDNSDWVWLGADQDGRDGWSWDFDTSIEPEQDGAAFLIWAFDWAGNWLEASSYGLGIDRTPPANSLTIQQLYEDAPFRDFWVNWWDTSDNLSGVAGYDVQYRQGANGAWTDLITGTGDTYYRFVGQEDEIYYFRMRARDNAGNQSVYSDGDGDAQHIVQTCPTPPDAYEIDNTPASAVWLSSDGISQTHTIHVEEDQDWTKFTAAAGVNYTLATANTGGHADTILYLYDTDGSTLIDSNDDYPGMNYASRLEWQPDSGGVYYLMVEHWDPYAYGCTTQYAVSITNDDVTPPTGNILINNGDNTTETRDVLLALSASDTGTGVSEMKVANSSNFNGATWMAYTASQPWTLSPGEGLKTVYVKYRDQAGNESATYSDSITYQQTADPPTAAFSAAPSSGSAPLQVSFTDQSTGEITTWNWNFGDGNSSNLQNPIHTYANSGTYNVTLTVSGPGGNDTLTRSNLINVTEPAAASIMHIRPAGSTATIGVPITVGVAISQVTNLGSFEFDLNYEPSLVTVQDISLAEFPGSTGRTFSPVGPVIDNSGGTASFGAFSLGDSPPGPSGSGVMAYIGLLPQASGTATLNLSSGQATAATGQAIPLNLQGGALTIEACLGDFDGDQDVDILDIQSIAYRWNTSVGHPLYDPTYDLDNDGDIDIIDIQTVAYRWGTICSSRGGNPGEETARSIEQAASLAIQPAAQTVPISQTFTIDVTVSDVEDLGAFEFTLAYSSTMVEVISATIGSLPGSTGRTVIPTGTVIDPHQGTVTFGAYSLGAEPPGPDGDGSLATLTLRALGAGQGSIDFLSAQISNRAGASQAIESMAAGEVQLVVEPPGSDHKLYLPSILK